MNTSTLLTHRLAGVALAAAALLASLQAQAADVSLSGLTTFHNDVVQIDFSLDAPGTLRVWTDSWLSGINFDPTLALFNGSGLLIASNDDADIDFGAGPGYFDAGISLQAQSGSYRLTLSAAPNFANGPQWQNGFALDGETPVAISQWDQPSRDLNTNDQKGGFWRVQFQGVSQAAVVPEPATAALLLAGLVAVGRLQRRCQP